ncbi:ABC transporter permease [Candidatus Bipolaricaulota bacterium]|nr:ABC transporter permease [Candidatus Bipolaricaulota bacterium]
MTLLRERETLFWFVLFPVLLLVLLTLIFGRLGQEGEMNFQVALLNLDREAASGADFATAVEEAFLALGVAPGEGQEPLFAIRRPAAEEDVAGFLAQEKEAVRLGNRTALIVIPSGFSERVLDGFAASRSPAVGPSGLIQVYMSEGNAASGFAAAIVEQVLLTLDRELLVRAGLYREEDAVPSETAWVGTNRRQIAYVDFLLPGVILMAFFIGGLFSVPGTILYARDQRILRRYWVTPLTVPQYLAGFGLGYMGMCLLQFVLLALVGRFGFGASVEFARPMVILYLALSAVTFLSFGFLVASLAKTANAGMAIANILNMPMMFLSGLFFPVADLPVFLKPFLHANPLTYLAEGLRTSLGVAQGILPVPLTIVVPLGWIALSTGVAARRLRWDVGR